MIDPLTPTVLYLIMGYTLIGLLIGLWFRRYAGITWLSVALWTLVWPPVALFLLLAYYVMRDADDDAAARE